MGHSGSSLTASASPDRHLSPGVASGAGWVDRCVGQTRRPNSSDKKRMIGLVTLRRRLLRRRRQPKALDHAKVIRDFTCDWSPADISALYNEYSALFLLRQLSERCAAARPPAPSCCQDLCLLYRSRLCTDVQLVYQGRVFPVHRCILSGRCAYFRKLLKDYPRCVGGQVAVCISTADVDAALFDSLLQYLYCGHLFCRAGGQAEQRCRHSRRRLAQLETEFGSPGSLARDMRFLLESGEWADALLVFRPPATPSSSSSSSSPGPHPFELPCHKAVLAARSPFFRSLIGRRCQGGSGGGGGDRGAPIRIELDEGVISRRYAYVLLRAMYMDSVDLALIMPGVDSSVSSSSHPDHLDDAIELYHIGRFVELPALVRASEHLLLDALCLDNVARLLHWAEQPHGSQWLYRQAMQLLCDEFGSVLTSPVLLQLSQDQLLSALSSDFLQASELEVLQAILRWSEYNLIKLMEEREPNLLSHTAHSVARKGVKRRELNDTELQQLAAPLLQQLRVPQLLPLEHPVVSEAVRRGLLHMPPSHMRDEDVSCRTQSWLRCKHKRSEYVRPRLFLPYVEEIKARAAALEGAACSEYRGVCASRFMHLSPAAVPLGLPPPDTLYMLDEQYQCDDPQIESARDMTVCPSAEMMTAMLRRRCSLLSSPPHLYQQAISCRQLESSEVLQLLNLHVVREFALPDCMSSMLQEAAVQNDGQVQRLRDHQLLPSSSSSAAAGATAGGGGEGRWRSASDLHHVHSSIATAHHSPHFRTLDLESLNLREINMPDVALSSTPAAGPSCEAVVAVGSSCEAPSVSSSGGTVPRRRHHQHLHRRRRPDLGDRQQQQHQQTSVSTELLHVVDSHI